MARPDKESLREREALIVDQYGGIYPVYEAFYIHSIIYAAERSDSAFQRFDAMDMQSTASRLVVATIQEALTHAGAVSRFFWPTNKNQLTVARGGRLREAFHLDDASPLKLRTLRNAFEHFDEKLDRFLLDDRAGCFFPGPIVDDSALSDEAMAHIFRLVDPTNCVCVLLGEKFEFNPIRQEIQRILIRALQMDDAGARL